MKSLACLIFVTASLAAPAPSPSKDTVTLRMYAVQAVYEGAKDRYCDPALEDVRESLDELEDYDTFRKIKILQATGPYNKEFELPINDEYTLFVTPLEEDSSGRVRLETRIVEAVDGRETENPINALRATSSLVPGDRLLLGGPKLERGKLVLVLTVEE